MSILPIENSHIIQMETLPHHHKDPFDRIIVAQAIEENLQSSRRTKTSRFIL